MDKATKDRINTIQSQLKALTQPKMGKYSFNTVKIASLQAELYHLKNKEYRCWFKYGVDEDDFEVYALSSDSEEALKEARRLDKRIYKISEICT